MANLLNPAANAANRRNASQSPSRKKAGDGTGRLVATGANVVRSGVSPKRIGIAAAVTQARGGAAAKSKVLPKTTGKATGSMKLA